MAQRYKLSDYVIQETEKSHCTDCEATVFLLCHKDMPTDKTAFYICWNCHRIGEVGKGKVEQINLEN